MFASSHPDVHPWFASPSHLRTAQTPKMFVPVCINYIHYLVSAYVCLSSLPLTSSVLFELNTAGLITSEECTDLDDTSDVVRVQISKSLEVMAQTSEVLKRHGFGIDAKLLEGKET